jgi:Fe-S cluster assembly iron-binding protein IscA
MSLKRLSALKFPLNISGTAWNKMKHILSKGNNSGFLFFASGGGCNGYNYKLEPIDKLEFESLKEENPTIIYDDTNTPLMIDPTSELLLMGTSIDFIEEDYAKNIFESRFFSHHRRTWPRRADAEFHSHRNKLIRS